MTRKGKANVRNKTDARLTPYDVKVIGTLAERPRLEVSEPRPLTPEEVHANNVSMCEFGKAILDMHRWIPIFRDDLKCMNSNKVGRPYDFSDSLIFWILSFMAVTDSTFRLVSGMASAIMGLFGMASPSYSRLCERSIQVADRLFGYDSDDGSGILTMVVCDNVSDRVRRVGIDSSGMNMSDTTLWKAKKWKAAPKNRGWLKLHALSDVDSGEIIAYIISNEKVGDCPLLKVLVSAAMDRGHRFECVYADGAYASDDNWKFLCQENSFGFVTSFKCNTKPTNNGCLARGEAARLWCSMSYPDWVKVSGYGTRWKCEVVFSDLKRIFRETVKARTLAGAVREVCMKIREFNDYKEIRANIMGISGNGIPLA